MSGSSNFTLTPNINLFKPTFNSDVDGWGGHWNANADTLDSLLGSGASGTFLPIAGGTMAGPLNYTATGSTTSRSAQDRAADWVNVKDFGAKLNGTANVDGPAIGAALATLKANERLFFPAGDGNFTWGQVQGTTPGTSVLFYLDGTTTSGGRINRAFSRNNKGDMFEGYYNGTKYLSVQSAKPDQPTMLLLEYTSSAAGGTPSAIQTPIQIIATDNADAVTSIWGIAVALETHATYHSGWPEQVGGSFSIVRYGGAWCAGVHITMADQSGLASSANGSGGLLGIELGHHANGVDDGNVASAPGLRIGFHLSQSTQIPVASGGLPAEFAMGYGLDGVPDSLTKSCFGVLGINTYQVFDARSATAPSGYTYPVAALRMDPGAIIDFNGAPTTSKAGWVGAPGNYLQYTTSGTPRLRYMVGGNEAWSIPDSALATDVVNLKNYGAKLDGTTNDSAAYAAARTAAQSRSTVGGVVYAPSGKRGTLTPPPFTAPPVLWKLDGMTFGTSGTTPVTNVTSGDLVESFFGGGKYYQRTDAAGALGAPVMRLDYTGPGTPDGVISLNLTNTDANFYLWGVSSTLTTTLTGPGQAVGFASEVTRQSGSQPLWLYFGHYTDQTGLGKGVLGTENLPGHSLLEIGATQNGPDIASSYYAPEQGGRVGLHFPNANYTPPSWAASHAYALGATVSAGLYTYIVQTAGTSGASPPTWPTAPGTVADGTVTWKFQTTVKSSISRMIDIAGPIGLGAALNIREVSIYDAGIEMSAATLDTVTNPNAAAIRIAANMPIDFSGNGTAAGQNLHTLKYDSTAAKLIYAVGTVAKWSVDASGNMRCAGTVTGSVTP